MALGRGLRTVSEHHEIAKLLDELDSIDRHQKLRELYRVKPGSVPGSPYPWQVAWHNAGAVEAERAIISANRVGKTRTAAAEVAIHLTGFYPRWWKGRRYDRAVDVIVAGRTNEDVRNIQQKALCGVINEHHLPDGSGWLPPETIGACTFRQCGVANVLDTVKVKHVSGGTSEITFKSYEQHATKFQGVSQDICWLDEEPEEYEIFTECQTRVLDRKGMVLYTNTPLLGMSDICKHFMDGGHGIFFTPATWDDAPHLDAIAKEELKARYPEHERATRTKGVPMMGTGRVYTVDDDVILCDPFPIPDHFRRIMGLDFGIDHPAAGAWIAYDADTDIVYLYDTFREKGLTPPAQAQLIRPRGLWIPVAWPHDGMARDKGSGVPLAQQYRSAGVNMLPEPAHWESTMMVERGIRSSQSREAGAMELLERMYTGRFKVCKTPATAVFMEEKRMLHRKGQPPVIVAVRDHVESAVRYAIMMLRYAISDTEANMEAPESDGTTFNPLAEFSRGR